MAAAVFVSRGWRCNRRILHIGENSGIRPGQQLSRSAMDRNRPRPITRPYDFLAIAVPSRVAALRSDTSSDRLRAGSIACARCSLRRRAGPTAGSSRSVVVCIDRANAPPDPTRCLLVLDCRDAALSAEGPFSRRRGLSVRLLLRRSGRSGEMVGRADLSTFITRRRSHLYRRAWKFRQLEQRADWQPEYEPLDSLCRSASPVAGRFF